MALGGLFKMAAAAIIAWAWLNGHLAKIAGDATAALGGQYKTKTTGSASPPLSSGGQTS